MNGNKEKNITVIVNCFEPFGPFTVNKLPLTVIDESLGKLIFFFPIFDIKIPYKLFRHQYYFF